MGKHQDRKILDIRKFSEDELNWVKAKHPFLQVRKEGALLCGALVFSAEYEDRNKKKLKLQDEYNVEIRIDSDNVPHVWEKGKRLQARADELKKPLIDMHVYTGGEKICMATVPMMKAIYADDPTIKGIFHNLIIRYFYYHTYWKQECVEPWDGLKHGDAGIIEEYIDNPASDVFEYSKYLSHELQKCLNIRKSRRKRRKCVCNKLTIKNCSCGIEKKYNIFEESFLANKNNHTK